MTTLEGSATHVHAGTPTFLSSKKSCYVHFHNFLSLPSDKGEKTASPAFECHGCKWQLKIFPGGYKKSEDGNVALFLTSLNSKPLQVRHCISIPKAGDVTGDADFETDVFERRGFKVGFEFNTREHIINSCLEDGTLTIRVDLQVYTDKVCIWRPKESLKDDIFQMFTSGDDADANFSVEDQVIKAHRFILKCRAPLLADIVESTSPGTNIPIADVKVNVFRSILEFLYADKCPKMTSQDEAVEMLLAANKFDCQRLKLLVEAELIEKYLNENTAIDLLLLSDGNSCASLKESAMHLVTGDLSKAMNSTEWTKVKESSDLLNEIMSNLAGLLKPDDDKNTYSKLSVREILEKLEERNLNVDGTRQMLLKRLRENSEEE